MLTGTNAYPDIHEATPAVLNVAPSAVEERRAVVASAVSAEPLPRIRLAEPFEQLRDRSDTILAKTGARPKIFLANLGRLSDFTARATFAKSFFEAGGIEAVDQRWLCEPRRDEARRSRRQARNSPACALRTKFTRAKASPPQRLSRPLPKYLYLAGRPAEQDALKSAGVGAFIYAGCDTVAMLQAAYQMLAG